VSLLTACDDAAQRTSTSTRARELNLPRLEPGTRCPTKPTHVVDANYGPAAGVGPVYAAALGTHSTLLFAPPERFESKKWGGNKVLWLVAPSYRGPALIRGRRLDGPGLVRFDRGNVPPTSIRLAADPLPAGFEEAWRDRPSYTRVEGPGCYGYQVDGEGFSEVIIFRVVAETD
jgi:hypothetical protein